MSALHLPVRSTPFLQLPNFLARPDSSPPRRRQRDIADNPKPEEIPVEKLNQMHTIIPIVQCHQLEANARVDLGLNDDEGGILRIMSITDDGATVAMPFSRLIDDLKDMISAEDDEDLVFTNIHELDKMMRAQSKMMKSFHKRCIQLKGRPLGYAQKVDSLKDEVVSLNDQLKKQKKKLDDKFYEQQTAYINLGGQWEAEKIRVEELQEEVKRLERENRSQSNQLHEQQQMLEYSSYLEKYKKCEKCFVGNLGEYYEHLCEKYEVCEGCKTRDKEKCALATSEHIVFEPPTPRTATPRPATSGSQPGGFETVVLNKLGKDNSTVGQKSGGYNRDGYQRSEDKLASYTGFAAASKGCTYKGSPLKNVISQDDASEDDTFMGDGYDGAPPSGDNGYETAYEGEAGFY